MPSQKGAVMTKKSPLRSLPTSRRRLGVALALILALAGSLLVASPHTASAAAAGDGNPDPHGQLSSTSASPAMLLVGGGTRSEGTPRIDQANPYYWINNWNSSGATITWTVTSDATASYNVVGLLAAHGAVNLRLTSSATGHPTRTLDTTTHDFGWDRLDMGSITIPQGTSTLVLTRTSPGSEPMSIKSLEFLATSQQGAYDAVVTASKRPSSQWISDAGYGIWALDGGWTYPKSGEKKSLLDKACSFDVPRFVKNVTSTGASYVIWGYTWFTYQVMGDNSAIDEILGASANNNTLTGKKCPDGSSADLNRKVSKALKAEGVRFILYYHIGHDVDPNWWSKQNFPDLRQTGVGDRSTFFANWRKVITEVGEQYGTDLDGWIFDDGAYYYPAKFEELQATARAGNPDRIITWNNYTASAYTKFSDWTNTDFCHSLTDQPGSPIDSSGVYTSGPFASLRANCNIMLNSGPGVPEGGWGVTYPNIPIALHGRTADSVFNDLMTAKAARKPISLVPMVWEGGEFDPATLDLLRDVGQRYRAATCGEGCFELNDDAPSIVYTGSWARSANRTRGDLQNDVHYTTRNGDSVSLAFTGRSARVYMPTDPQYGSFTVSVDGVAQSGSFTSTSTSGYNPRQNVFEVSGLSAGRHTITITKTGGTWLTLDSIRFDDCAVAGCVRVNNDRPDIITYTGSWGLSAGRGLGDWKNDVQATAVNGSSAKVTFTGTAAWVYMPAEQSYGAFTVTVDGVAQPGVFTTQNGGAYQARQSKFSVTGLAPGSHTIVITKTSGSWLSIDHVDYLP
jgi:hypothetical protein